MSEAESNIPEWQQKLCSDFRAGVVKQELMKPDIFNVTSDLAHARVELSAALELEKTALKKLESDGKLSPAVVLEMSSMVSATVEKIVRLTKIVREIENAGQTYTTTTIVSLIDKIAAIITYHVDDEPSRRKCLASVQELQRSFVGTGSTEGTLLTPDQDAAMMDATVPGPPEDSSC